MPHRPKSGIALPEILMVLLILGLVAAAVIPRYVYSEETKAGECRSNILLINSHLQAYARKEGRSPDTMAQVGAIVAADRDTFPTGMPKCPYGRPYEYNPVTGQIIVHKHE
jgi:type II secretory pathway pseudopilin PulG